VRSVLIVLLAVAAAGYATGGAPPLLLGALLAAVAGFLLGWALLAVDLIELRPVLLLADVVTLAAFFAAALRITNDDRTLTAVLLATALVTQVVAWRTARRQRRGTRPAVAPAGRAGG
jgi:hypothetical protein